MGEIQPLDYSMLLNAGRTFNPMQVYLQSQQVKGIQSENRLRDLQYQAAAQEMPLNLENKRLERDTKNLQLDEGKKKLSREEAVQTLSTIGAASKQLLDEYSNLLNQPGMTDERARNQMQPRYAARMGQLRESGLLTGKVQDVFDPSYLLNAYNQSGAALQRMEGEQKQANIKKTTMETAEIQGRPNEKRKEREKDIEIANMNRQSAEKIARMTHQEKTTTLERLNAKYASGEPMTDRELSVLRALTVSGGAKTATAAFSQDPLKAGEELGNFVYPYDQPGTAQPGSSNTTRYFDPKTGTFK